jgi:hypothetical protein
LLHPKKIDYNNYNDNEEKLINPIIHNIKYYGSIKSEIHTLIKINGSAINNIGFKENLKIGIDVYNYIDIL